MDKGRASSDSTSPVSTFSSEGIITAAQHDMQSAAQHGILAPPPPNAGKIGKLFHQAKELFKFYFRGVKLIFTNRGRARQMQQRVKDGGPPLTRWEHQFIKTYKQDVLKLVPFALIIIIIEEIIPLIVIYAPFILPSTCILPSQKERIDDKRREKQRAYALSMRDTFERIQKLGEATPGADAKQLLNGPGLVAVSGILGHSNYSLNILRMFKIRKHLTMVAEDDAFLLQEEAGLRLTPAEMLDALGERGILTQGLSFQQQQRRLQWWLTQTRNPADSKPDASTSPSDPIVERLVLIARSVIGRY